MIKVNINDNVRVRLTEHGRKLHREWWLRWYGELSAYPYQAPGEDADGWSRWQLWNLMSVFGEHMYMGGPLPFLTEIEIPNNETRFVVYDEQAFRERYGDGIRLLADPEPEQPASEPEAQREPCGMPSDGTEVSQLRERITELETERDKMLGDINVQAVRNAMNNSQTEDALARAGQIIGLLDKKYRMVLKDRRGLLEEQAND